ncbi:MAG: zf-HC2 domain-containing protein [Longimicrobiales bacterium]
MLQQQVAGATVSCRDFLDGHSDYLDGALPDPMAKRFDAHVRSCTGCQRYDHVLRRGLMLARNLPEIQPSIHFHERLQAELMDLDAESIQRPILAGPATVVMIAAVLAVIALTPLIRLTELIEATPPVLPLVAPAPLTITPFSPPPAESWPPAHVSAAVLVNALEPATFSPVVVSPPVVQTTPNAPRLIAYPLLQTLTR